jgi:hypothetical protein
VILLTAREIKTNMLFGYHNIYPFPLLEKWRWYLKELIHFQRIGWTSRKRSSGPLVIRWAVHHLLNPFSFQKGAKEMAIQILMAQSNLRNSIQKGVVPKRFRTKKYFKEAVLFFWMEAQARGKRVPRLFLRSVSPDLLPWWGKELRRPRSF